MRRVLLLAVLGATLLAPGVSAVDMEAALKAAMEAYRAGNLRA